MRSQMINKTNTKTKRIFDAPCAKYLLKEGFEVLDLEILEITEEGEKYCFVFEYTDELAQAMSVYSQNKMY